jgi:tetratricopeptide (TPR) repeat protein
MASAVNWEFSVSINHTGDDRYYLKVENVPAGGILAEAQVSWAVEDWLARTRQLMNDPLQDILQGRDTGTSQQYNSLENMKFAPNLVDLGQELYDALFQGTIRDSWLMAQAIAQHYRSVLRLRIGLRGITLPRLPWEVMHHWNCPLAATTDITFSRYQILSRANVTPRNSHLATSLPLRILMVIATPGDQESLELRQEAEHLRSELKDRGSSTPMLDLTILEQPGREELTYALEHGNYHIFHYSGHSNLGSNGGNLFLVNNQNGLTETLSGNDLAGLLSNNGVQLVVFNSCRGAYSAASEVTSTTGNLTQSLINRGIPAVLAMSERIPDNVALTMTRLFYRNLNQGYPIDLSLSRARQGLISTYGSHQLYWALPVLYLHPDFDGFLWQDGVPVEELKQVWTLPQEELGLPHGRDGQKIFANNLASNLSGDLFNTRDDRGQKTRGLELRDYELQDYEARDSKEIDRANAADSLEPGNQNVLNLDELDQDNSDLPLVAPEDMSTFFRHSRETVTFEQPKLSPVGRPNSNPLPNQATNQTSSQPSNQTILQKNTENPNQNTLQSSQSSPSHSTPPTPQQMSNQANSPANSQLKANSPANSARKTKRNQKTPTPLVTRSPQTLELETRPNKGSVGAWLSVFILFGAIAGAGGWWYHQQQLSAPETNQISTPATLPVVSSSPVVNSQANSEVTSPVNPPVNPTITPAVTPEKIDIKTADTPAINALGSQYFQDGELAKGIPVVRELLDRNALEAAKTTLNKVRLEQTETPELNFLRGRLAWQSIKTGSRDYSLEDVWRFWEAASKNEPESVVYLNALGFSYYEVGDFSRAKDVWLTALKIIETSSSSPISSEIKPGASLENDFNPNLQSPFTNSSSTNSSSSVSLSSVSPSRAIVENSDKLNTYAGLALVFNQLSDNLLRRERNLLLNESANLYKQVMQEDGLKYQPEILARQWLWTNKTIQDWTALGN